MAFEFKITRQIEFSDTDLAGLVHYANFFRYMEAAEHAFYRSLGFSVHGHGPDGVYGFPRVHAQCDFLAPVRFEETIQVHLLVARKGASSIAYQFVFRRPGKAGAVVALGKLVVVHVRTDPVTGRLVKAPLPALLAQKIHVAPPRRIVTKDAL